MRCTIELCSKFITPSRLFLKDITIIDHKIHFEWTENKDDVLVTEKKLKRYFNKDEWNRVNSQLVLFGRYVCTSQRPNCDNCNLKNICKKKSD